MPLRSPGWRSGPSAGRSNRAQDPGAAFSEMALYVLVRRDGTWWIAAGQNTPIRTGGAA